MTRRLFFTYLVIVAAPLAVAAAAFALRDRLSRRQRERWGGDGHGEPEGLEHTVEEVRPP